MWSAAQNEEEARAYLQTRLVAYSKMMFWSFIALLAFLAVMYRVWPDTDQPNNPLVFGGAAVMLAVMSVVWRVGLVRRKLSIATLNAVDMMYAIGIGASFAASAALTPALRPSAYTSLIFACFTVFTRALVIPSSGQRTTFVASLAFLPILACGVYLAGKEDIPPGAFISGTVLISAVTVLLATTGSHIIYGFRRQVTELSQLGQYTLEREIGAGGMGKVYRARHMMLRRPTAVKVLNPDKVGADNLDRFEREVQEMSKLTHPNTVAVFDYSRTSDGQLYYAMEYLGGGVDLERLVRTKGPQPSTRVANILEQVCGALQEAHDHGLIHRDIKPANIILCERGGMPDVAKVVDFGLVKNFTADTGQTGQVILGTPAYIAPEAVTDPRTIGPAVDLYALGATGYFLLTGRCVFEGKTAVDTCIQHVTAAPKPPSSVAAVAIEPGLEALIMQCLAKVPTSRPASASALADGLRALPKGPDWDDAEARRWWREFRAVADKIVESATPTQTITVDLEHREPA